MTHAGYLKCLKYLNRLKKYLLNVAIALDQLANALRGGAPDETLSAAAWRTEQKGRVLGRIFRPAIDLLAKPFERDHCRKSYESERTARHLPGEYQNEQSSD
jgi:hypothetical protein